MANAKLISSMGLKCATALVLAGSLNAFSPNLPLVSSKAFAASKIVALVNNVPITSNDVSRRAAFFKLRRSKGNLRSMAKKELIEDALKMQEARRIGAVVSDQQVNAAFSRFAQRNKMPEKALRQILSRSGVTVRGFKQYIKGQMSWQRAVTARFQSQNQPKKAANPLDHLHGAKSNAAGRTTEYTVQQIIFVVPRNKLKTQQNARFREALNFRSRFPGCEGSTAYAANLRDVTVRKRGRKQAHELPPFWRNELEKTRLGKTTKPQKTDRGVELLALCKKRDVLSKVQAASTNAEVFGNDQRQVSALEKKYIAELRKVAKIKNR